MTMVPIGDVTEVKGGGTPSKRKPEYYQGDIPWVTPKDMKVWDISDAIDKITPEAVADSATNLIPARSILLVNRSGILKHTLPVGITRREVAINQDLKALICSDRAHPEYLAHIVKAAEPIILKWVRATTADNFPIDSLKELKIPLPALDEQRRVAGILDQADALRRLRSRALDKLNSLGQAIFHEMFGDLRTNERGWQEGVTLGDLAEVVSGITKGRKVKTEVLREVPYLAVSNVQDRFLKMDVVKTIDATEDEINRFRLYRDDILLTEGGDPDKLGRGTLWKEQLPECIHQNHVFRVRVTDDRVRPAFLSWQLGSERGKAYFLRSAKQTTGIASINKTQINAFPLLLPPPELQKQFEERLNGLEAHLGTYKNANIQIGNLFTSLQHRAFKGEL